MRKNYFKLLLTILMMVVGGKAWAAEVTTIYEKGTSGNAWSSDDLTTTSTVGKWSGTINGNTGMTITSDPFLQISARGKTTSSTGSLLLNRSANTIVTLDAVWNVGSSDFPSNDNSTYFTYGGFSLNYFTRYNTTKYTFNGTEKTITSIDNSSDVSIHLVVNTVNGKITDFSVSSDGTTIISLTDLGNSPAFTAGTDYNHIYVKSTNNVSSNNTRGFLKSITVKQEILPVQTANYTVNWVCNNQTVKTETRNAAVGSDIALFAGDTDAFFNDSETIKYIYDSDDASGKTVASNGTSVVTVKVHEAKKYAFTVTSSCEENPLEWSTSGEVWEDENTVKVSYPRFQAIGTTLVERLPVSNDLTTNITVTGDGYTQDLAYTATDVDNLYLLSEAENLETSLSSGQTTFTDRVSNRAIIFGVSGTLVTLPAGSYIFTLGAIGGDNNTHQVAYTVNAGETQIIAGNCTGNWLTLLKSEEFSLTADTEITFTCSDPASNRGIDLIYIQKTSAPETAAYIINYQFEGEIVFSENGEAVVGSSVEAKESVTVTTGEGDEATSQLYYVEEGQPTTLTITAEEAQNMLNVSVRLPLTGDVAVNAVDGEGNILKTFTAEATEGGEKVNVYYTRAIEVDGVYYTVPAKNGNTMNYGVRKGYGEEPTEIVYTKDENIVFYAESENLSKTRSFAANGNVPERASGGEWHRLYANSYAYTPELEGGVYKILVSGRNQSGSSSGTLGIQVRYSNGTLVGEEALTWGTSTNAEYTVENLNVPAGGASIAIVNGAYNSNIGLDYVILYKTGEAQTELVTVTSAGVRTYCSENVLDFSDVEGLKAYFLTVDGDRISMNETTLVGGFEGVYIEAAEGSYEVPVMNDLEVEPLPEGLNDLVGVTEATQIDAPIYVLMNEDKGLGFYKTSKTFTVGAHTAYIPGAAVPPGVKALGFGGNDDPTTGINGVNSEVLNGKAAVIYNLAGQRVTTPVKGIYIVNGKKVMVK